MYAGNGLFHATFFFRFVVLLSFILVGATPANASDRPESVNSLRLIGPIGPSTLDPHGASDAFTVALLANFFEPLVKRGPELDLRPNLAVHWEQADPRRWRFHLREDVRFHNGQTFGAEDVVHSFHRSIGEGSRIVTRMAGIDRVEIIDDLTVDFHTTESMPLLPMQLDAWLIVDRDISVDPGGETALTADAVNGTGPFELASYSSDVSISATAFDGWWRGPDHNLDSVDYRVATAAAARVASARTIDADIIMSIPVQDVATVDTSPGVGVVSIDEPRAIFLGLAQQGADGVETPLADERVRRAVYHAIDVDALISVVLRGFGTPVAAPIARQVAGYPDHIERRRYDPDRARDLLRQAGVADDISLALDCTNDRYVNDEAICTAITGMLERIGINVRLRVESGGPFTQRLFEAGESDLGLYLLGWLPSGLDSGRVLADLVAGPDPSQRLGVANITGYADPELDSLIQSIQRLPISETRAETISDAWQAVHDQTIYVPLYQQQAAWAVRTGVTVTPRADGMLLWNGVRLSMHQGN